MGKIGYDKQKGKKLSKAYVIKKKKGKITKATKDVGNNNFEQKGRIVVRNVPFQATENELKKLFEPFGTVQEVNMVKNSNGKFIGCCFIQFESETDASKAIFKTNKINFLGRIITCTWAIPKVKYYEQIKKEDDKQIKLNEVEEDNSEVTEIKDDQSKDNMDKEKTEPKKKMTPEERKLQKLKRQKKRARIIVRNIPFKATEDTIKNFFSKFGNIEDVNILSKSGGTRVGCCFIQYELVKSAANAVHHANMKQFLDRTIVVDWALPKNSYAENVTKKAAKTAEVITIKEEVIEDDNENKNEAPILLETSICDIKSEESDNESIKPSIDEDEMEHDKISSADTKSDLTELNENLHFSRRKGIEEKNYSHAQHFSHDIQEGKTVFLKNVPFRATNEDLKKCMEQFGPVYYALVCKDPLTEHSRGTAFVKFKNVEDAEKCLSAGTELQLLDQILDPHKALPREEVLNKKNEKSKKVKDSRNLYLVREGVILAGSPSAVGVSAADMARRLQLEQWKSQMLRNLNMFVSRQRLIIHNLPPTYDNEKLQKLFQSHSGPNAIITEARVMRDLKNVDEKGIGKSKGHGFVSFTNHEDALKALRAINNNPKIFTEAKRPIVAFSIENRIMVNAKQRRIIKSRERNPLCSEYNKLKHNEEPLVKKSKKENQNLDDDVQSYSGVKSKIGPVKMRSKYNIKKQALLHAETLKNQKKQTKQIKKQKIQLQERIASRKEVKPKQKQQKNDIDEIYFQKCVNNYKSQLTAPTQNKAKWYET